MKEKQKNNGNNKRANNAKKTKKSNNYQKQESDNQQIGDVMGWGKSKNNYYQEEEEEYSQLSQQYQQAEQIYHKQQDALDQAQFYNLPGSDEQNLSKDNQLQLQQQQINEEYIQQEIVWCLQLTKLFQGINDDQSKYRTQLCHTYLMILMCLKQFKNIPYIQEHPMFENMQTLKKGIKKLEKNFETMMEQMQANQAEFNDEENLSYNQQSDQELQSSDQEQMDEEDMMFEESDQLQDKKKHKKLGNKKNSGLQLYEQMKAQKQSEKKLKKQQNKRKHQKELPSAAFKTITDTEGRLASEKIVKNKGLMKRHKKIDGNSRVKLREKYRKAQIKRRTKGFIGVRQDPGRFYEGQNKVLMGKISSTKL